jgi:hypothetical protein
LAQLASLRELTLRGCEGLTLASLEQLLSTATQGHKLVITVEDREGTVTAQALSEAHSRVIASRGATSTPQLSMLNPDEM